MVKIYKTTDRLSVKIDSLKFKLAPLSFDQKAEIQSYLISGEAMAVVKAAKLAIKYSVKDIQGVENLDGSPYELEMENGSVSDSCIDDLLNIDQDGKLSLVCTSMLQGIPTDFVDPQSGEKVKGISIERPSSRKKEVNPWFLGLLWEYIYFKIFEISSLSDYDYICLVSNYNNFDDDDQEQILRDRGFSEAQIKNALGQSKFIGLKSLNVVFTEEPKLKYPLFGYVLTLYNQYKLGSLPFSGGTGEQPAQLMEIFTCLDQLQHEAQEKLRKKQEKENKRGKR